MIRIAQYSMFPTYYQLCLANQGAYYNYLIYNENHEEIDQIELAIGTEI
jgi:hypothetical protein